MKSYLKNAGQENLCRVQSFLPGGQALLSAFTCIWKISSPPRRDLGSQYRDPAKEGWPSSHKRKQILTKNFTETRDLGKEG